MDENITVYTIGCSKCIMLENALDRKQIKYTTVTDVDEMKKLGFSQVPMMKVNDEILDFNDAWRWVSKR